MIRSFSLIFIIFLVASCAVQQKAIVELKGERSYGNVEIDDSWTDKLKQEELPNQQYITVADSETLYSIANKYKILYKDLAEINHLKWPYKVHPGQTLLIPEYQEISPSEKKDIPENLEAALKNFKPKNNSEDFAFESKADIKSKLKVKNKKIDDEENSNILHEKIIFPKQKKIVLDDHLDKKSPEGKKKVNIINSKTKFRWPVHGRIISQFGPNADGGRNDGINIEAEKDSPVKAALSGQIIYSSNDLGKYGNLVIIKHENEWFSAYAHLKTIIKKKGDKVKTNETIGLVGKTGNVSTEQLHFAIRNGKNPVNPIKLLPKSF